MTTNQLLLIAQPVSSLDPSKSRSARRRVTLDGESRQYARASWYYATTFFGTPVNTHHVIFRTLRGN